METPNESLPDDLPLCHEMIRELVKKVKQSHVMIEKLQHQLEQLLKARYGPRADRIDPNQVWLFDQLLHQLEAPSQIQEVAKEEDRASQSQPAKQGHGRKPLPAHLPRKRIEHDIDPADRICDRCGEEKTLIGMEKSEQLEYIPASFVVNEHIYLKYACKPCEDGVVTADRPSRPIEKGLPGPGLLAHVTTSKYSDHLPLARQENIFRRHGVEISRSTQCDWMRAGAQLLLPLYESMKKEVLCSKVVQTDDTPVPVRDRYLAKTRPGRLWVYRGDEGHPYTVYDYTASRKRDGPASFLSDFKGYLQADAYGGYDGIYATKDVKEVACWAHARRKFVDAQSTDSARAVNAVARIRLLYDVEEEAKDRSPTERYALRQERSKPTLEAFESWLREEHRTVLPKSPIGEAIAYALSNWQALIRYTEDGDLSIDNNGAERALRSIAVGRKNWLFCGSDRGGETASVLYSFTQSAKRHRLDPFAYLRDVFDRINDIPMSRLTELLPDRWKAIRDQPAEQASSQENTPNS